jgi:hypothetical protein
MTKETDGNGEMKEAAAQAQPMATGPTLKDGVTYMLMPSPLMAELVKILRDMPYEKVERVMRGLGECQPVHRTPPAAPARAPAAPPAE